MMCKYLLTFNISLFCTNRRQLLRLTVFAVCGFVILYNEWIVYFMYSLHWPNMKCGEVKTLHPVLLVADPQILGEKTENFLARWDSDRLVNLVPVLHYMERLCVFYLFYLKVIYIKQLSDF